MRAYVFCISANVNRSLFSICKNRFHGIYYELLRPGVQRLCIRGSDHPSGPVNKVV